MQKVLVSACLIGKRVRYDGNQLSLSESILKNWLDEGRVISVCPEVDAGMSIPRARAEIGQGAGVAILENLAKVIDDQGEDVTAYFKKGAEIALSLCKKHQIKIAVLTEKSPSCGSSEIYDGTFSGKKLAGEGVTTALLRKNGIQVFSQNNLEEARNVLRALK